MLETAKLNGRATSASSLEDAERLLGIGSLEKPAQFSSTEAGRAWAGARDYVGTSGNVKRGVLPVGQLGYAPSMAELDSRIAKLPLRPSLDQLVRLRIQLLREMAETPEAP